MSGSNPGLPLEKPMLLPSSPAPKGWIPYHSDGIGVQQLLGGHCSDISDIGKDIHKRDQWNGDEDGSRKIPVEGEEVRGEAWSRESFCLLGCPCCRK